MLKHSGEKPHMWTQNYINKENKLYTEPNQHQEAANKINFLAESLHVEEFLAKYKSEEEIADLFLDISD